MKRWRSEELASIYEKLLSAGVEFVIIGGQAVNLWSEHYLTANRQPEAWASLLPFTSHDLDLLGGRIDAVAAASALKVEAVLFDPLSRQITPNAATLYVPLSDDELMIQFLHTPRGARREEIRSTAQRLAWKGMALPVMHPVICVESKLECLYTLDQRGRQDLRHLRLSLLAVQEFIFDLCEAADERSVLGHFERLAAVAAEEFGLRVQHEEQIELESAIHAPVIRAHADRLPKLGAFYEKRWPQLEQRLRTRRARYAKL